MMKLKYDSPKLIEELIIELEGEILHASVATEDTTVESVGQEYEEIDFTGDNFNVTWE